MRMNILFSELASRCFDAQRGAADSARKSMVEQRGSAERGSLAALGGAEGQLDARHEWRQHVRWYSTIERQGSTHAIERM